MKRTLLFFLLLFTNFFYAQVANIEHCAGNTSFNLTLQKSILIGNLNPAETTVSYHLSLSDANDNLNVIVSPENYTSTESSKTIYARIDNNGTITTNYFNLILNPILTADAKVMYVNCVPRIVITGNGGDSNYEYSHFGVTYTQDNFIITPSPGNQTVYVRDGNGCVASKSLIVESLTPLTWLANMVGVTCQGGNDGTIQLTASGGKAPYQYSIGNEFTSSNIFKNLSVGDYTVRVQDATGCIVSVNFTMRLINSAIAINPIITNDSNTTNEGKIDLIVSGGVAPYTYSLKNSNGTLIPSKTSNPYTGLAAGSYEVIVTDSHGCTFSQKGIDILNAPTALTTTAVVTPITCVITTGTITLNPNGGVLPYRYSIDNGNNYTASNVFSNLTAGSYNLKVLDAQNAEASAIAIIEPIKIPQITTTYKSILCHGDSNGSILVGASNGKSPNLFSINGGEYTSYNLFENLSAGNYVLSVKDSNGCVVSTTVTLEDPAPITAKITYFDRSVTVTASGGYGKYEYALDGGTYSQSYVFSNVSYGNHIIYVRDPNKCILTQPISVVKPVPLSSSFSVDKGTVTITTSGGILPYKYSLQKDTGFPIITTQSNIFTNLINGSYKIVVNDAQGNSFTLFDVIISESALFTVNATSTPVNCNGLKGTITATATGGESPYQYSIDSTNFSDSNVFSNLNAGNYTITVRDSNNFKTTTSITISNAPPVLITAEISAEITCFGAKDGIIKVTAIQGQAPYTYAIDNTNFQPNDTFRDLSPGMHTIQVLDKNNCTSSVSVTLVQPTLIQSTIVVTDKTITASTTGGTPPYTYSLQNKSGVFIGPQTSNIFENLPNGVYSLQTIDKKGCFYLEDNISISDFPLLTATATISPITCVNPTGTITVNATGGSGSYEYSIDNLNYSSSNIFSNLSSGNYIINVKDSQNTVISLTAIIIPFNSLVANAVATKAIDCLNNASINVTASGGKRPYQYSLNDGSYTINNIFTDLRAGSYFVRVKDSLNCTIITNSIVFDQPAPLIVSVSHVNPSAFDSNDGSITVLTSGGIAPYEYTLMDNNNVILIASQSSNTFNNLASGIYIVLVKDGKGCLEQKLVITIAPSGPLSAIATIVQPTCINPSGIITITATGGSGPYQYSINGSNYNYSNVFNVTHPGSFIITVRDNENTFYTLNATVSFLNPVILSATWFSPSSCDSNGTITATASGGQAPYFYSINGGAFQNNSIFNNLNAGIYSIQAKDNSGCTQNVMVELFQPPLLSASVTTDDQRITIVATGGTENYEYSLDGVNFQSNNTFTVVNYGTYDVFVRDLNGCFIVVTTTLNPPSPLIDGKVVIIIDFKPGQTLGDLVVDGQNIKWYSSATSLTGKTNKSAENTLPLSTVLVDGTTYYASQTINGIESKQRLAVTVKLDKSLSTTDVVLPNFKYYPNPVQHTLAVDNTTTIDEIEIISVSGKSVLTKKINNTHSEIDLSNVSSGFYFLKVKAEGQVKTIKIVKK